MNINQNSPNENAIESFSQFTDRLTVILDRLEFEQARKLAGNGDYSGAQAILIKLLRTKSDPAVLDLLARVYAQQGQFSEAQAMWERALAISPKTSEYIESLSFLAKIQKKAPSAKQGWEKRLIVLGGIFLLLLVVFLLSRLGSLQKSLEQIVTNNQASNVQISSNSGEDNNLLSESDSVATLTSSLESGNELLLEKINDNQLLLGEISATTSLLLQPTKESGIPLDLEINVPGTTSSATLTGVQVRFDERLFLYETTLTSRGKEMLEQVGRQLEPYVGKIEVQVIGFTDSIELNRKDLQLERGTAVVEYLINHTHLPVGTFIIASGEGRASPFPSGSVGDKFRERTVLLEISILGE